MLADARGFVFDLDGTLVRRGADGPRPLPGAKEVLAEVRRSGRPLVVFTNASHVAPATLAAAVRAQGLVLGDEEVVTPICSMVGELRRRFAGRAAYAFATAAARERLCAGGVELLPDAEVARAEVILVAHADAAELDLLEAAAHAVRGGAPLLTANYAPAYAGADGPVLSRAAMLTAAIARVAEKRPRVVGKPSLAAVRELSDRLGIAATEAAVVGDDLGMDIALGHLGGSTTVLVRTGISADSDLEQVADRHRPDIVLDDVGGLLEVA